MSDGINELSIFDLVWTFRQSLIEHWKRESTVDVISFVKLAIEFPYNQCLFFQCSNAKDVEMIFQ